jgi:hypothetical protein
MVSKDLMRSLSQRLEPVRDHFSLQVYQRSLALVRPQVTDDSSLFWIVPSRVITNLHRLLGSQAEDRLRFFLVRHACRHQKVLTHLGQPIPPEEEVSRVLRRCIDPQGSDVQSGLLPLLTPVPRLNRRELHSLTKTKLAPLFEEKTDPSDKSEWLYETQSGPWRILARIQAPAPGFQLDLEIDVLLGMGDLSLSRQLSLHQLLGIGPSAWDLAKLGDEDLVAELAGQHCRFMVDFLSPLLCGLEPGISREEVLQAEREWKEWLAQVKSERMRQSKPRN